MKREEQIKPIDTNPDLKHNQFEVDQRGLTTFNIHNADDYCIELEDIHFIRFVAVSKPVSLIPNIRLGYKIQHPRTGEWVWQEGDPDRASRSGFDLPHQAPHPEFGCVFDNYTGEIAPDYIRGVLEPRKPLTASWKGKQHRCFRTRRRS